MKLRIIKTILLLSTIAVYGGCGQKGELYLPDKKQTAIVSYDYIV